jgi:hypothetical protein
MTKDQESERDYAADMRVVIERPADEHDLPTARVIDHRGLWAQWKSRLFATWAIALLWGVFVGGAYGTYVGCCAMKKQTDLRADLRRVELLFVVTQCFDSWYTRIHDDSPSDRTKADNDCDRAIDEVVEEKTP